MPVFLFRLWTHWADDGLLPEVTVSGEAQMEAAALALHHFIALGRPLDDRSLLESESLPCRFLRVGDVLVWLCSEPGERFCQEHGLRFAWCDIGTALHDHRLH